MRFWAIMAFQLCSLTFGALHAATAAEKFNNADVVLVSSIEKITVKHDGTSAGSEESTYRILTEQGKRNMQHLTLHFNASYSTLTVKKLEVIKPDGKIISLDPAKHSSVSIEDSQMSSRIFDPANKICAVMIPDLQINDLLRVVVERNEFKARFPGHWSNIAVFQADFPIQSATLTVDMPSDKILHTTLKDSAGNTLRFSKSVKGDRTIYSWEAKDVPQIIPEPGMPPMYTCVQRALMTTVGSWEDISRWYDNLCAAKIAAVSPQMRECVNKLIADKKDDMSKIMALFQFVSQRIRYTGITDETTAPGYEPHDAARTFERGHGVCRDKAALLAAMLKLAGLRAFPVIFMSGPPKDIESPNLFFNHAIVAVDKGDRDYLLMDPTFETTTELFPAFLGNCSYLVARKEGDTLRRSPVIPAADNLLNFKGEAVLDAAGTLNGRLTMDFAGLHDQIYRSAFSSWQPERIRQYFFAGLRKVIPGAELLQLQITPSNVRDMSKPLSVTISYKADEFLRHSNPVQVMPVPEFAPVFGTVNNFYNAFKLEKRRFPLEAIPREVRESFTMQLPKNIITEALPQPIAVNIKDNLRLGRKFTIAADTLTYAGSFAIDTALIPGGKSYDELKKALCDFDAAGKTLPVIRSNISALAKQSAVSAADCGGADAIIISDNREIKIAPDKSVVDTRTVHRKIVTYAGAVKHSTLSLPYIENFDSVTVSGYSVSPDGKKHILAPAEINHLDAPWTKDVKRYPKGKILTAAFPGIVPGSEVCFTYTRKTTGREIFYAQMRTAGSEPVINKRLTVHGDGIKVSVPDTGVNVSRGKSSVTAEAKDIPRSAPENAQPDFAEFTPTFRISTGNYPDFAKNLNAALTKQVAISGTKTKALADAIRKNGSSDITGALHRTVTELIRPGGPAMNTLPWSCFSSPETTLVSGSGNSTDRAIVYAALLNELNIKWQFVAVSQEPFSQQSLANLAGAPRNIFTSLLVYLPKHDIYLNATTQYGHAGANNFENKIALDLSNGTLFRMETKPQKYASRSLARCKIDAAPNGDAVILFETRLYGNYFEKANAEFASLPGIRQKQYFEKFASSISQSAKVLSYAVDFTAIPAVLTCRLFVPGFSTATNEYLSFDLPGFETFAEHCKVFSTQRKTPFKRDSGVNIAIDYEITVPDGTEILRAVPSNLSAGNAETGIYTVKSRSEGKKLFINTQLDMPSGTIPAEAYSKLLDINKFLNQPDTRKVLLKKVRK